VIVEKKRFDLEAAQVTWQRASPLIRTLPVVHVLPPDEQHNTPVETTKSKYLTGLGKARLTAIIARENTDTLRMEIKGTPTTMWRLVMRSCGFSYFSPKLFKSTIRVCRRALPRAGSGVSPVLA
jgi:hypothetical protein